MKRLWLVLAASLCPGLMAAPPTCFTCHTEIAKTQADTAMAKTWHVTSSASFPSNFRVATKEGPSPDLSYEVRRLAGRLQYSTEMAGSPKLDLSVEAIVGGTRHGLSFLARVDQVGGVPLQRSALIEARYAYSTPHAKLSLSPGFDTEKPANLEDALGRTLSPAFERKCLACHGQPQTSSAQGGVHCENCHGPVADHVNSLRAKPASLHGEQQLEVCGQCHSGLSDRSDPMPDDLLVSNQVPALRNSECFLQSGHALTCTGCHNPHQDSTRVAEASVATCLGCHSASKEQHPALCPVNAKTGCIGCHMPAVERNSFLMTDHWIRVHPEQGIPQRKSEETLRSHVPPKHEFLRMIAVENQQSAEAALARLKKGEPFAQLARQVSIDETAPGGGYIGDMDLSQMDAKLATAAAQLTAGDISPVIEAGGRFLILYRMPRDFKWQAEQLYQQASLLKTKGDLTGTAEKDQQALDVYPYFLRALVLMGTTVAQAGDTQRASGILQFAAQFYPKDASAQFDYALTLSHNPAQQIEAFQHALELDPDMTAGYESLGAALFSSGQRQNAIAVFRKGLEIDPLSASLYYNLSLALAQEGDAEGAKQAIALARQLDPKAAATSASR